MKTTSNECCTLKACWLLMNLDLHKVVKKSLKESRRPNIFCGNNFTLCLLPLELLYEKKRWKSNKSKTSAVNFFSFSFICYLGLECKSGTQKSLIFNIKLYLLLSKILKSHKLMLFFLHSRRRYGINLTSVNVKHLVAVDYEEAVDSLQEVICKKIRTNFSVYVSG